MTALGGRSRLLSAGVLLVLAGAPVLTACGGSSDGSAGRPDRTASPIRPSAEESSSGRPARPWASPEVSVEPSPSPVASEPPIAAPIVSPRPPSPSPAPPVESSPPAQAVVEPSPSAAEPSPSPSPSPVTSPSPSPSAAPATTSSDDESNPWPWILLGAVVLAGLFLFLFLRRRGQEQRMEAWRQRTRPAVEAARLSRDLLPALGRNITDLAHWTEVRAAADEASRDLQGAAASAPAAEAGATARAAAEALSGLTLALESARLLQASDPPPTSGQIVAADDATQTRKSALDAALAQLDLVVGPPAQAAV